MRVSGVKGSCQNYHGGPVLRQARPPSILISPLKPGKIFNYRAWRGLYVRGLEGVKLAGIIKSIGYRSGGGLFWGVTILGLYNTSGGLRYIIYISKDYIRGLRAYETQEPK